MRSKSFQMHWNVPPFDKKYISHSEIQKNSFHLSHALALQQPLPHGRERRTQITASGLSKLLLCEESCSLSKTNLNWIKRKQVSSQIRAEQGGHQ